MSNKDKLKNWLKDKYNFTFLGILAFGIIIRFYYFFITNGQPLWWDEADYLAYAKNLAGFPVDWIVTAKHNSIYPYLAGLLFKIGGTEFIVKFMLQLVPSILTVYLSYQIPCLMYKDRRIALISSLLMSVFWVHLFNTMRFHVDILGLFVGLLSIYVFWKGYERKEKLFGKIGPEWAIMIAAGLAILSYTIRRGYFLFGAFFLIYMLLSRDVKSLIKDKYNWLTLGLVAILFIVTEKYIFISKIAGVSDSYFHTENPITFLPFEVFGSYFINTSTALGNLFLFLFWIFLLSTIANILLSFGTIRKNFEKKSDLFNLIVIFTTLFLFIYVLRNQVNFGEPRWYFPLALSTFMIVGKAFSFLIDSIKPYNKNMAAISITVILLLFCFYQIQVSNNVIDNRTGSFIGIRDASLFIKESSDPEDIILTMGMPQVSYYSERVAENLKYWASKDSVNKVQGELDETLEKIEENEDVRYLLISISEPNHPDWAKKINGNIFEIPFMDSRIDLSTGQQQISQEKIYGNLKFTLIRVERDVFIYEIIRL